MSNPSRRLLLHAFHRLHALHRLHAPQTLIRPFHHSSRSFSSQPSTAPSLPSQSWRSFFPRDIFPFVRPNLRRIATTTTPKKALSSPPPSGMAGSGLRRAVRNVFLEGKFDASRAVKAVATRPLGSVLGVASKYKSAAGLQVEAFWKRNYLILVGAGSLALCIILWRVMFGIASTFVGLSEGMAKYGFLALASAMVAFMGLYVRARYTLNPDKIYRIAMRKLNTSAGILEIMGAPLAGTDVRAYVMSGGGAKLKNFKFKLRGKRCFIIFPIRGSERRGLVSVEVKKRRGQYDMKLLAVDIPMVTGPDQRIFLIGDAEEYKVGGGLISELRDPIVKAMAAEKEFEELDRKEEEEDEKRELEEEEIKRRREIEKLGES